MNILLVADVSISRIIGGAERFLYEQSTRLARRGHNLHILTRRSPRHGSPTEIISGVKEWRYDFNAVNPMTAIKTTLMNARHLFEGLCQRNKFDIINFHQPFSAMAVCNSEMSSGIPKIYTCHSLSFEEYISRNGCRSGILHKLFTSFQTIFRKKIENKGISKSNKIVVLSNFTRQKLTDAYGLDSEKVAVIPGGVDLCKFNTSPHKASIRANLKFPPNHVLLLAVRNLVQRMGLENLLIAFQQLEKDASDAQLIIGGTGPLEAKLIALARELGIERKVHFVGFISEDQLPLYYQMADLFVLPTKELEGFGLVTLEAMACGLPVVGTPVGGTKEILAGFDSKFLFQNTTPQAIAKLMLEKYHHIKNNPEDWATLCRQSRKFVETNYSWEANLNSLEKLFEEQLDY